MIKGSKGLASGIIVIILLMFVFALGSLFAITFWNNVNDKIQLLPNETISPSVKAEIEDLGGIMLWADKLFIVFFLALLVSYLFSVSVVPTANPAVLLVFAVLLIFVTVLAMVLSNTWTYMTGQAVLADAVDDLTFTNWFLTYYPIISFLTGVLGAIIFYSRRQGDTNTGSFGGGGFEIPE